MKAISGKYFCKILESHGWFLARINGSHHIYVNKDFNSKLSVPVHGNEDLKIGILKQLLKTACLTESDL